MSSGTRKPSTQIQASNSKQSLKRSAPPLLLETHGSPGQAIVTFCLHLLALCAVLGATAHTLHYLFSEIYLGQYLQKPAASAIFPDIEASLATAITHENQPLAAIPALLLALIAVIISFAFTIAIVNGAVITHLEARQRMRILWQSNGNLRVQIETTKHSLNYKKNLRCRLAPGCYSSHWLVILSLRECHESNDSGTPYRSQQFFILLARDSMANENFRHLRLWMRLVAPHQL